MKKINFNKEWNFILENQLDAFNTYGFDKYSDAGGAATRFYEYNNWEIVDLPHDWTLQLSRNVMADAFSGGYPNTRYHRTMAERHSGLTQIDHVGWYRKQFMYDPSWAEKRIFIAFEGVFRDAVVWVNGVYLDRHNSGYTGFILELTDHLVPNEDNSIAVRVDSEQAEGWWYEGAGIYRNVYLLISESVYFKPNQTVITTNLNGNIHATAVLINDTADTVHKNVNWCVKDKENNTVAIYQNKVEIAAYCEAQIAAELQVDHPQWWSVETPYLYTLQINADEEQTVERFGIRTVQFDPGHGFLLNGKKQKVRGACVHQDFGGVGIALSDNLNRYKIQRLKEMGVNAYRCAHHAPSPSLLEACDELGMLVMDETRTFGTSPEAVQQLTDLIERDRNHPCVFVWALGNEEFAVQNNARSARLMQKMTRLAKALDPTRAVTYGGNNGANDTGANGVAEVRGINYIRNGETGDWVDQYHEQHPEQPIIGTEESSYVLSRGGAVNDLGNGLLDSTGSVTMHWGSTPKGWVKFFEERDYLAGSFMWTGFDYRGEPNPFYHTNVGSSFGTIDLCGMEKPPFYYYKSWWTDEPVLKLTPHWNHSSGEVVTMAVFTNCEEITLSLNGRTLETRKIERFDAPIFTLPFEPGTISVTGRKDGKQFYDELITSGKTAQVRCVPILHAYTEQDTAIYQLEAYDENGVFCPMGTEEIVLSIQNGQIVGVGNGDPSSMDSEQNPCVEETKIIRRFRLDDEMVIVPEKAPNIKKPRYDWLQLEPKQPGFEDDFRIVANYAYQRGEAQILTYCARITDAEEFEYVEFERLGGDAEVYLNGEKIGDNLRSYGRQTKNETHNRPYRFPCRFRAGENELKIVSKQFNTSAPAISGYVKLGKRVEKPWHVKLHYGKARVFVKSKQPTDVVLKVCLKENSVSNL